MSDEISESFCQEIIKQYEKKSLHRSAYVIQEHYVTPLYWNLRFEKGFTNIEFETTFQLLLAIALGVLIGFERQLRHRPAGLTTHILMSLGSRIFTVISLSFDIEPAKVATGIVSEIGFLQLGSVSRRIIKATKRPVLIVDP